MEEITLIVIKGTTPEIEEAVTKLLDAVSAAQSASQDEAQEPIARTGVRNDSPPAPPELEGIWLSRTVVKELATELGIEPGRATRSVSVWEQAATHCTDPDAYYYTSYAALPDPFRQARIRDGCLNAADFVRLNESATCRIALKDCQRGFGPVVEENSAKLAAKLREQYTAP